MKSTWVTEITDQARKEGRLSLTEAESKSLLSLYGIPVVEEATAVSEDDAIAQSREIGLPVVLKGLGARLIHKTERGLVKVNLKSDDEVRQAYRHIKDAAGEDWEACLIQPFIEGNREFAAGLIRDPQFGPSVMFGLGGILTEALSDVTFRIAPLDEIQARSMLDEIRACKLLGAFRGEAEVDKKQLIQVLMSLSRLGMDHPEIREIDINPFIVMPDGSVRAVDALVVLANAEEIPVAIEVIDDRNMEREKEIRAALDVMMHARSIAVLGATVPRPNFPGIFECVRRFGFNGRLYPVNPRGQDYNGIKFYSSLSSLPEKVDLVIVSIPAPLVPEALRECVATGNRNVHIFTAGFKETGEEEGLRLQAEIEKIAREGGLHVVGPNCMGFYVPASRMLTWTDASKESGPVSFVSQSGGNAQDFTHYLSSIYNIHFSKCISFGNALTLDSCDFIDYLSHDEDTKIITMYLEGVKDGSRLLRQVREISRRKPVILYKSGLTESGARAVSSHTGSMAGGEKIWKAFFRQTGAIPVDSLEEMADVTLAVHHIRAAHGRKTTVLGIGGGNGVAVADSCARAGLELPAFSPDLVSKLRNSIGIDGSMIKNPIDSVIAFTSLPVMGETLELLAQSGEIDNFIISMSLDWLTLKKEESGTYAETVATYLVEEGQGHTHGKPLIAVLRQYQPDPTTQKSIPLVEKILLSGGIPVYKSLSQAVSALSKLVTYNASIVEESQARLIQR
jgi:acyl-CoA synthetase (NDP forming)